MLTLVKSAYIQKRRYWVVQNSIKNRASLRYIINLGIISYAQLISSSGNYMMLVPLYFRGIQLLSDVSFFPAKRYNLFLTLRALKRLTYLSPSCFFVMTTDGGCITHHEALFLGKSGQISALCV